MRTIIISFCDDINIEDYPEAIEFGNSYIVININNFVVPSGKCEIQVFVKNKQKTYTNVFGTKPYDNRIKNPVVYGTI